MQKGMKMTYLFDAKYRIDGNVNGVDTPPNDAINQMHRYRDAIYYKDYDGSQLKKEVIGGYILFPGDGAPLDVAKARFQRSIDEVNIGAFPLRPKDVDNRKLLEDFIAELIGNRATDMLSDAIPQKGLFYQEGEPLYLLISASNQYNVGIMTDLKNGLPCKFSCSHQGIREDVDLRQIRYLIPVLNQKLSGYYAVNSVNTKVGESLRIEFELDQYKDLGFAVNAATQDSLGVSMTYMEFVGLCNSHVVTEK